MISHLCKRGSLFLGSHYPILGGAMSWVSDSLLTASISNAGGFGVLASGAMSPDLLREEILRTQQKTSHSFGVNLIVMHPLLDQMIDACHDVSYIVLAGGIPSQDHIHKIKNKSISKPCRIC